MERSKKSDPAYVLNIESGIKRTKCAMKSFGEDFWFIWSLLPESMKSIAAAAQHILQLPISRLEIER